MKRTLLCALVFLCCWGMLDRAYAINCEKSPMKQKSQGISLTALVLPVQLFVTVTQKPVIAMGKSAAAILHQILSVQARTKGMPAHRGKRVL